MSAARRIVPVVTDLASFKDVDLNKLRHRIPGIHYQAIKPTSFSSNAGDKTIPNLRELLDGSEIVIGDPSLIGPHWYNMPPSVKWIQSTWAGVDGIRRKYIDPSRALPEFIFTRLGSGFGPQIASYTIGQIIALERHFYQYVHDQADKKWVWKECEYGGYRRLADLTISILGVGAIGENVAKVCKSFDMRVCGLVRKDVPIEERSPFVDEYFLTHSLPDLLRQCDYICNILPSTEATRNLLSSDMLKNCKAKARFINVGRGDIIDDESLLNALSQGWLDHAVLDVCSTEPLPTDSPLWEHPKVSITPHVAGLTEPVSVLSAFEENLELYEQGKQLKYQVDWTNGY